MKNMYPCVFSRWLFMLLLLGSQALLAQTAPTIQWQKVIPTGNNPGPLASRVIVIKNGTAGYLVSSSDRRLLSLNSNGDITSDTPVIGLFADGSTSHSLGVLDMAMTSDANVVLAVQDNAGTSVQKRTTSGSVLWNNRLFPYSNDYGYTTTRLVANLDGSIICFATYQDRRVLFGEQYIIAIKLNSDGTQQWSKTIRYPGATVTIVERAIAGNNGQYLLVGSTYAPADNNTLFRGWAATISGSGDVVWQRRYDDINGLNAVAPFGDNGNAYVINGPLFSKPGGTYTASSIVIDNSGNINTSFPIGVIPDPAFNSLATLTAVPNTNRPAVYVQAFDTPTAVRGGDLQLTAFSSENKILWSKTVGGSGRDYNFGPSVVATDNGFIVAGITESTDGDVQGKQTNLPATWIVKLDDPNKRLTLTQPSYNCATGAITFNTIGGDGSTITFSAPGIMRSSANSNSGTVEQGLRNDPKTITITATQSGQTTTYSFDLKAACSGITPTPTMHPDMQPLVDLYNATNGPSWKNKTNWLTGNNPCNWFGVSCNADSRVIGINLGYNNLNGTLPSSLGNLSELQRFIIFTEPLVSGTLPASLGNLSKLQLLEIEYTQISGSIPESLGNLKQLTQLFLAKNELSGSIPESLGNLSSLKTLYLFGNQLTGNLPNSFASLPQIQSLHLYANRFSGCIPSAYTALCGKDVQLNSNVGLPGGGDFAAFCANPSQNCGPNKLLTLTQPTYNCSTGAITFNLVNGDGSPVTYTAPGIIRSAVTSNSGTVEQGLRNDPKTIIITAIQSGYSTSFSFDLKAYCSGTTPLVAPPLLSPIPDQTRIVGKPLTSDTISISRYFGGVGNYPGFRPVILFLTTGIPPGMTIFNNSNENRTSAYIGGTPTTPGVYVVTVSAFISNSTSGNVPTTTTKFQITILDNSTATPPPTGGTLTLAQPTYNCSTGAITFNTSGGNGAPITYTAPGITRSSVTSNTGFVEQGLRNDPKTITITATQSGQMITYSFDLKAFCSGNTPTPSSTLKLLPPVVDCSLRQVTLVTSGGDGSTITFNTPTITRSSTTSSVGIVDLCVGAKPPVLQATQSGFTATYESFDFAKQCPAFLSVKPLVASQIPDITLPGPDYRITLGDYFKTQTNSVNRYAPLFKFQLSGAPDGSSIDDQTGTVRSLQPYAFLTLNVSTPGVYTVTVTGKNECDPATSSTFKVTVNPASGGSPLTLVAPGYDCSTGGFTFNYTGGNGSPVEFQAAGITGWTTNPNQFVDKDSRTAGDVKPFTLMARQNGQLVTYTWDLKAACGRSARMATTEAGQALELTVKGNPVGNTAVVEIRGAEGQALQLDLLNASGRVIEQRHIEQAGAIDEQRFDLQRQPTGLLFLRAQSGQQKQTVKLIKQ